MTSTTQGTQHAALLARLLSMPDDRSVTPTMCDLPRRAHQPLAHEITLPLACLGAVLAPRHASHAGAAPRVARQSRPAYPRTARSSTLPPPGVITTYAGGISNAGGSPINFGMQPYGVAVDNSGHLLITDSTNYVVWLANFAASAFTSLGQTIPAGSMAVVAGGGSGCAQQSDSIGDGCQATQAVLYDPAGVALDGAGNLYIAQGLTNRIREVRADTGVMTTVAGNGSPNCGISGPCFGGDGGPATQAELNAPYGVAVDGAGNLYIADDGNERIREVVAATGIITTVAGTSRGFSGDGGPATRAQLNAPSGVAVDAAGNFYIADGANDRIREVIAATGIITTVAGGGSGCAQQSDTIGDGCLATQAELNGPYGVAVDMTGNLYVADESHQRIREVLATTGIITTVAGDGYQGHGGDGGPAIWAELAYPTGVAVDVAGNLYIADEGNYRVREVQAGTGIITTVAGNGGYETFGGDGGLAAQAELSYPAGVALDAAGNLYIADYYNNRVREVLASTGVITTVAGINSVYFGGDGGPATQAELYDPIDVALDRAGNLYIADEGNQRIREVIAATGIITTVAGGGSGCAQQSDTVGDGCPATQAELSGPSSVTVDGAGNLYIAEDSDDRVREVLAATGIITTVAGTGSSGYGGDGGPATQAELNYPSGLAVDGADNLYIADDENQRVREVQAGTGIITTVAGTGSSGYGGDGGPATQAELNYPSGLAVDGTGNLYIADQGSARVREVQAGTGIITTVAGNGSPGCAIGTGSCYGGDGGPATQAELSSPSGLAVDGAGNLYIADDDNNRVRVVGDVGSGVAPPPGPVSPSLSSLSASASTTSADGLSTVQVLVTVRDINGNPVAGKTITVSSSRGVSDTIVQPAGPTDASGQAIALVTSNQAGVAQFGALDVNDGLMIQQTATVTFTASGALADEIRALQT